MSDNDRDEVEAAFRQYYLTGPVLEDWGAWSKLFTDDSVYLDHFYGSFHGPAEIEQYLVSAMGAAPHVYSPLEWYNIDGPRIVYKVWNRADNPDPAGPPAQFPSLQIIEYAGAGRWSYQEDWWTVKEMKQFNVAYEEMCTDAGQPDFKEKVSRRDWGPVSWARPPAGHQPPFLTNPDPGEEKGT